MKHFDKISLCYQSSGMFTDRKLSSSVENCRGMPYIIKALGIHFARSAEMKVFLVCTKG